MLLYVLKLNQNAKMPEAYGKYYAYPVITQTVDIDGLAEHMASHNTPFSKGAIKGMITDMVSCVKELTLQGFAVKIDDLAIFSIGIRNKEGAASEKEFTIAKNIDGFRLRARGTGEFSAKTINLEATLKKASALLGDGTTRIPPRIPPRIAGRILERIPLVVTTPTRAVAEPLEKEEATA